MRPRLILLMRDIVRVVLPIAGVGAAAAGTAACIFSNAPQCGGGGGGPVTEQVTMVAYNPVCNEITPNMGAGDAEAGDGGNSTIVDAALDAAQEPMDASTGDSDAASAIDAAMIDGGCVLPDPSATSVSLDACQQYFCRDLRNGSITGCSVAGQDGGATIYECHYFPGPSASCGRRPAGCGLHTADSTTSIAAYLVHCARLEAVSVDAFAIMAAELRAHGAPAALVRAALRAERDEVRHARTLSALAAQYGGKVPMDSVRRGPVRSLVDIALENAIEGCVRETYGALVATYQAEAARDPRVGAAMRRIAVDEARHAELAHDVHAWICGQLTQAEHAHVLVAMAEAIAALNVDGASAAPEMTRVLGLPTADVSRELLRHLDSAIWSAAA